MSEVDALFRLLTDAPPRSAEIVKRYTLGNQTLETIAPLYEVTIQQSRTLVLRALIDVESGGSLRVPDDEEPAVANALFDSNGSNPLAERLRSLVTRLNSNAAALRDSLQAAAVAFERSPDRRRDEWLRRLAIIVVLALTAFFYWREANKPRPPPEKRPLLQQTAP